MNIDLAKQVYEQVTTHPELHDQSTYACGSSACIAGWTCLIEGFTVNEILQNHVRVSGDTDYDAHYGAIKLLDIDMDVANSLFLGTSNSESVEILAEMIRQAEAGHDMTFAEFSERWPDNAMADDDMGLG